MMLRLGPVILLRLSVILTHI